jgi:hypothetical protein
MVVATRVWPAHVGAEPATRRPSGRRRLFLSSSPWWISRSGPRRVVGNNLTGRVGGGRGHGRGGRRCEAGDGPGSEANGGDGSSDDSLGGTGGDVVHHSLRDLSSCLLRGFSLARRKRIQGRLCLIIGLRRPTDSAIREAIGTAALSRPARPGPARLGIRMHACGMRALMFATACTR